MTDSEFLNINTDTLNGADLAEVSEALLLGMIPCHFCGEWTPQRFESEFYLLGGCEVCDECEAKFQQSKAPNLF